MKEKKILFNDEVNTIEVNLGDYPALAELKKQELIEQGMSEEDAIEYVNNCNIDLELFYHKGSGLFGIESGAVESCGMGGLYSPYDGKTELIEEQQDFYNENRYNGEIVRTIDTLDWGEVDMVARYDADSCETFYDMYQRNNGGYIGEFILVFDTTLDDYSDKEIEDEINFKMLF